MSIVIFSQSLKNEGTPSFSIDGEFQFSQEKVNLRSKFLKNLEKVKFKDNASEEVQSVRLSLNSNIFLFKMYCNQKDNIGRFSPILIQLENLNAEKEKVQEYLEIFLKDCKNKRDEERTISDDIKKKFGIELEKCKNLRNQRVCKKNIISWIIVGVACAITGGIMHKLRKLGRKNA